MTIFRILIYPFKLLYRRFFKSANKSFDYEDSYINKKPSLFRRILDKISGSVYFKIQQKKEAFRIYRYNRLNRVEEQNIGFQFASASKKIFLTLFITILLSLVVDFSIAWIGNSTQFNNIHLWSIVDFFKNLFSSYNIPSFYLGLPDIAFIQTFIGISVAAISVILGLIFALYTVGFQLTTDKYSSEVSDYINNEKVGNFFFKLLIFTDLFLLYLLLEINIVNIYPFFAFLISLVLISLSLFGILTFKNSYLTGLKPRSLFGRMLHESEKYIEIATNRRLFSFSSVSVILNARKELHNTITLLGSFFEDLKRNTNWNDSVYAPLVFSQILVKYIGKKRYLDSENGWWFFQKYKEVKADNSTSLVLKLNYELQGTGPLNIPFPDLNWVENEIASWFKQFNQDVDDTKEKEKFTLQLISAYKIILFGEYEQDKDGRHVKTTFGSYGNQEFETFDTFLDLFFELFERIDKGNEEIMTAYSNTFFAISQSVLDGFKYDDAEKLMSSLINENGKFIDKKELVKNAQLPSKIYKKINDYYERLEVEQYIENKIITPKDFLIREIINELKTIETKEFVKQIKKLATFQEKMAKVLFSKRNFESLALLVRSRMDWFSRLLYLDKFDIAEEYSPMIPKLGMYISYIPKKILLDFDFQLQIEKIIFTARLEGKENLFKQLLILLMLNLHASNIDTNLTDPTQQSQWIKRSRILVILGGFVYLISELEQKPKILGDYVQTVGKMFEGDFFVKIVDALSNLKGLGLNMHLQLIESEISRYHHWFGLAHRKIDELPKTYDYVNYYSGMHEVADHPSKFIRQLSYGINFLEETIITEFSEWVQKRRAVMDLIQILKAKL